MCIEHSAKETKCRGESGGGRGDGGRAALEKWTVEAGVTLAHTRAHIHTHTQISSVFGLLLPPALIMSVQSSHDASLLPLVDLGIKRVLPLNTNTAVLFQSASVKVFGLFAPAGRRCKGNI